MAPCMAALGFLTILPLPKSWREDHDALGRSVPMFPFVGILIGILMVACDAFFTRFLPTAPASVLTAIAMLAISGGLHMDGLSDTADGFFSARPREPALEIMRDSRIGAMGVMAIVAVFFLKVVLLGTVPPEHRLAVILFMPLAGRCAMMIPMSMLPYARTEGGLATVFHAHQSGAHSFWAQAFLVAGGFLLLHEAGAWAAVTVMVAAHGLAIYMRRKIGGMTGDTLGAVCELCELIPAIFMIAWQRAMAS
mgnify:CR=1 FL=1